MRLARIDADKIPPLTKAQINRGYKSLLEVGISTHSRRGAMVIPFINRLEEERRPYTLQASPGMGYVIKLGAPDA